MPNSSEIVNWKNQIMSDLQNDDDIIAALDLNDKESPDDLIYNRFLPYYFMPNTQEVVKTYILVEIDVQSVRNRYNPSKYDLYAYPTITFYVLAHQDDMRMKQVATSAVRTDYISTLLDKKYNGTDGFGLGRLQLTQNVAGSLNDTYRYRQLVFQAVDLNNGICG